MPQVTAGDLTKLGDICSTICYYLTAHLASIASGGTSSDLPPEVGEIYRLAAKLPKPEEAAWKKLAGSGGGKGGKASGGAGGKHHRIKWDAELEADLVRLVEDEEYRTEKLGKEGTRGGSVNWAAIARHFDYASGQVFKSKYGELKGTPVETKPRKEKKEAAADGEKPAKKAKKEEGGAAAAAAAAEPPSAKKAAAAAGGETPGGEGWSKKQGDELVKLVDNAELRKTHFGKRKLRWKRIADHFDKKAKACKKQYHKLTGKEAPEDED